MPNRPVLTIAYLAPDHAAHDKATKALIETMTRECGSSGRTFKSAVIWCVADNPAPLYDEAKKLLAWEDIRDEADERRLDDTQRRQLADSLKRAERDLRETVWRTYKIVMLLGKDNTLREIDLGLVHSSQAENLVTVILNRLRQHGDIETGISPRFLVRNWLPALTEWSTKAVRDAFFASPQFPRLLNPDAIKETIAGGVADGQLAYVGKAKDGHYDPFLFKSALSPSDVEIADDVFIITADEAKKHIEPPKLTTIAVQPETVRIEPGKKHALVAKGYDQHGREIRIGKVLWSATGGRIAVSGVFEAGEDEGSFVVTASAQDISGTAAVEIATGTGPPPIIDPTPKLKPTKLTWSGEVPHQKWMNFYTRVLMRFVKVAGLKLTVTVEATPEEGVSEQAVEETKLALRELGLKDDVKGE